LYNLAITSAAGGRRIAPLDGKKPAFLAVCHQPQAFAEEVFADVSLDETPSALAPNDLPAALRLAGRSRVVYQFPSGTSDWDASAAGFLDAMT
ncbi:hypothetical protein KC221_23535, partial [Mycobacterium tuberculosis]|nr:hypothetical protein [Mycobacterium tuberculosis]